MQKRLVILVIIALLLLFQKTQNAKKDFERNNEG
jgi:hypothetical protein